MLNHIPNAPEWLHTVVMPVLRWLHIVATALLVGGTLFYEFVIPKAIEDLKEETQLSVLGRVRWVFRRVVLVCVILLVFSGLFTLWQMWPTYHGPMELVGKVSGWHVGVGAVVCISAIRITIGNRVPRHPIAWLRVNFVIMLIVVYLASMARHLRLSFEDDFERGRAESDVAAWPIAPIGGIEDTTTQPSTAPTTLPAKLD